MRYLFAAFLLFGLVTAPGCGRTPLEGFTTRGEAGSGGDGGDNGAGGDNQGGDNRGGDNQGGDNQGGDGQPGGAGGSTGSGGAPSTGGNSGGNPGSGGAQGGNAGGTLTIVPSVLTLNTGTMGQFRALFQQGQGTRDVTFESMWQTQQPGVIRIDNPPGPAGRVTALQPGKALVTATFSGITATATAVVNDDKLVAITVSPGLVSMAPGGIAKLSASALYGSGRTADVTAQVTWASADKNVAAFDVPNTPNVLHAANTGKTIATATLDGISGSATVVVEQNNSIKISVNPFMAARRPGELIDFTATAYFSDGTQRNVAGFATWTSSDDKVATLDRWRATCRGNGEVIIVATYMGASGSATLTCQEAKVVLLQLTPSDTTVPVGTVLRYNATAFFDDNTSRIVTNEAMFSSANPTIASMSLGGVATARSEGLATIMATWQGATGTATMRVFRR